MIEYIPNIDDIDDPDDLDDYPNQIDIINGLFPDNTLNDTLYKEHDIIYCDNQDEYDILSPFLNN